MTARLGRRALLIGIALVGCGNEVPAGGVAPKTAVDVAPKIAPNGPLEPSELIPKDLDFVLRVDLRRIRAALPEALEPLATQAGDNPALRAAIESADIVYVGLRSSDVDRGDRVIAVEGKVPRMSPDLGEYEKVTEGVPDDLVMYQRRGRLSRETIAGMVELPGRGIVFASAIELPAVKRLLRTSPDSERGSPPAEGFISLDYRVSRLAPHLEEKFPSISNVIAGLTRTTAVATLDDQGILLEATIAGRSSSHALRARRFLEALVQGAQSEAAQAMFGGLEVEQVEQSVHITWRLPAAVVLAALSE